MGELSLRQVRYFVAVAEELHVGRVAASLHVSQPALSQQLRRLERDLGVELFVRVGRGIELSPAGIAVLPAARCLLDAARDIAHTARGTGVHLEIGLLAGAGLELTPRILRALTARAPEATFILTHYDFTDPSAGLASGHSDVAFVRLPFQTEDLDVVALFDEPRSVMLSADHPLSGHERLQIAELITETWCCAPATDPVWRDFWRATAQRAGQPLRSASTTSFEEMLETVAAGRAIAVVSASTARLYPRPELRFVPVTDLEPTTAAVARRKSDTSPLTTLFLHLAENVAAETTAGEVPGTTPPTRRS